MKKLMTKLEYEQALRDLVHTKAQLVLTQQNYDRQFFELFDQSTLFPKEEIT